jgi:hypothetical protein
MLLLVFGFVVVGIHSTVIEGWLTLPSIATYLTGLNVMANGDVAETPLLIVVFYDEKLINTNFILKILTHFPILRITCDR